MIHQFRVRNFLSIREEQILDFTASASDKTYEEYTVVPIRNYRISKIGVIYGSNASGKSNILIALDWLFNFILEDKKGKEDEIPGLTPFLLDSDSRKKPTYMYLSFFIEETRYEYSILLDSERIFQEELNYYPFNRKALIYSRTWDTDKRYSNLVFGNSLKLNTLQKIAIHTSSVHKRTVLSAYVNANIEKVPILDKLDIFFNKTAMPLLSSYTNIGNYANKKIKKDEECRKFVCNILRKADLNISDLFVKEEKEEMTDEMWTRLKAFVQLIEEPLPEDRNIFRDDLYFIHKTPYFQETFQDELESLGTKRMYGLSVILYFLVKHNNILFSDELESSLHYDLLVYFIKMFLVNSQKGQIIFSTHSLMLLDEKIVRRDAIFFAEKNPSGATEIFKAKAFGLHKDVSILNAYRAGKLGAKPELGSIYLEE
ncbi:AAA family ATPase [Bacteroides fragilis]|jgi:AAA15 family ATPase/GTPase|uniref:AAA family ATPase n=1 Tax=Bacteroides fragilis TaxID=817 RepID=UPI001071F55C|nr:ATP-binding protein [Bacteroides fragilis]